MKKYLVGIFSHYDGDNQMFAVIANDPVDAAKKAIIERTSVEYRTPDFFDWINGLGDNLESVLIGAVQSEFVLTEPYCVFN